MPNAKVEKLTLPKLTWYCQGHMAVVKCLRPQNESLATAGSLPIWEDCD